MANDQMEVPLVANFNGNPRVQWTPQLHERFLSAITVLGGPYEAKPKAILEIMGVQGLTLRHIKSHLQKYRASFNAARVINDMQNGEQTQNEFPPAPIDNNAAFPQIEPVYDMGGNGIYDVSGVHNGTEGIPHIATVPFHTRAHESQVQTRMEEISSMPPTSYDIGDLEVYDVPQFPLVIEEIPHMLPDPYDTRSQDVYVPTQVPIGTEINPYLQPAPNSIRSYEVYDIPRFQTGTEGFLEPQEMYTSRFADSRSINDTGKQLGASSTLMDYATNTLPLPAWEPTPYAMTNQEVYNQTTTLPGIEGEVVTTSEYYGGNLDSSNNEKGQGTMGLHPQDVVAHHLEFPMNSMPSYNMLPTPNGMGGYKFYDGSSVQREMEESMQQASEQADKHVTLREDAHKPYIWNP